MKRGLISIMVGVVLLAALSLSVTAQDVESLEFPKLNKINIPKVEKITLDNGMRLYILEDRSLPIFRAGLRINTGTYLEPADKIGLAEVCGMVMRTGGTEKWTGDEIDEMLEGVGGSVETGIDVVEGSANVNILSEYTDLGLEVLAEILRRPVFDEDKINLAKVQQRTGIARRNDELADLTRREFKKQIYGPESPYARHTEYATINAITRDDLIEFHKKYIRPENIQMALWGDFDKKDIITKVKKYFGDWPKGNIAVPPPPQVNYQWRNKVYYIEKPEAKQSYIRVGHIGGMVTDPDYTSLIVMNSILGGGFGSRVTNNVRTKMGLAYSAGGRLISEFAYPGYFFIAASTGPENTVKATREIIKQINSMLTDLPTEEEMKKGKDGYLNSFVFNFDSKGEVLARMRTYDFYGLPENFLEQEKEGVEKITPEAVMAAAKNNLRPDQLIVIVTGNAADFDEPLEALGMGPAEPIDITIPVPKEDKKLVINDETLARGKKIMLSVADAHGGVANFKNVKTLHAKGKYILTTPGGEFPLPFESYQILPDRSFSELNAMGRKLVDITNGEKGWKTDMTGSLVDKTAEDIAQEREDEARQTINIFSRCDAPDFKVVYDGTEKIDDQEIDYIVLLKDNDEPLCRLGIINDTYRLYSSSYWGKTAGGEGNITEAFSNFKEIAGVTLPMDRIISLDGQKILQISQAELYINEDVPASTFNKPE
ncbi:MAG: insulinase family protein [candidate division Zixibacteria bacterium]|nr:insulinase family protein [candidate division Zixibacteria bacterium]